MKDAEQYREENELLRKELDIMTSINSKIQVNMNFDQVLDDIIETILEKMNVDMCNFAFIDEDGYMRPHKVIYSKNIFP